MLGVIVLKLCLSFDIGGTFIKYAIIDSTGKINFKAKIQTPSFPCRDTIPKKIIEIYEEFKNKFSIDCIGISTAGIVNVDTGVVEYAVENIPAYTGTDFIATVGKKCNAVVFVDNDVNSAAAGEMWLGSSKNLKNFLCLTIGTGIGGAIVIDNKIYRGNSFAGGEVGHFIIVPDGNRCTCGKSGCYERYASTSALIRMYKEEIEKNGLRIGKDFDGEYIVDLYYKGDEIAKKVYNKFLDYIAYGIANLSHILDPGTVIIGGGISAQGKPFFDEIKKYALESYARNTEIKQATLANDAGMIGAAFNAFTAFNMF